MNFDSSRGRHEALKSIDLDIFDGEFLTILGPSGCGKTTL
ncbi:MAG: ATP-binding cassette domain-containing protein, partial [Bacteroidota bacterium]